MLKTNFTNTDSQNQLIENNNKLMEAVLKNQPSEVKSCIEQGADVNTEGLQGITALLLAIVEGFLQIVSITEQP